MVVVKGEQCLRGGWGGEGCRVTLHGASCPVSTVAPAGIDLDEKPG